MNNPIIHILRFLYRIKYWLIICPSLVALIVYYNTTDLERQWTVKTTIYTGIVSGFDIESSAATNASQASINNAMDNIINIISSESTLKRVSMRLYAQHMMYGDPVKDTKYITAKNFNIIYNKNKEVLPLIDKTSEENTLKNLYAYEEQDRDNYVFGLFNWTHQHYSKKALSKIEIKRLGNSDMLDISYAANDPAIAYTTLMILNEEFIKQYEELRFGETNNVIKYFEDELARLSAKLREVEDDLTEYNTEKQVINYGEQTKYVAALGRDFEIKYEEILLAYSSSKKLVTALEKRIDFKAGNIRNNMNFMTKLNDITALTSKISALEPYNDEILDAKKTAELVKLKKELENEESSLTKLSDELIGQQYSKEGVSSISLVDQWLVEIIRFEKAEAELKVMEKRKKELDLKYEFFSPVGSTLKRKEREIGFTEQSYLSVLNSLNAAKLRRRNLQMTSATIQVINPPVYPIEAEPYLRKIIVFGAFFATFVFLLGIFVLLELIDRTLRNKQRAEKLTDTIVIGAMPKKNRMRYRSHEKGWLERAARNIGNSIMSDFKPNSLNVVNIISIESNDGKSQLAKGLENYFIEEGLRVLLLTGGVDFSTQNREFHLATTIKELHNTTNYDVVLIEYPALCSMSIPSPLLNEASMNLLAVRANRSWKDTDQLILNHLKKDTDNVRLVLTDAERLVVEIFTGLLPPYTFLRRLTYRIYQLGLTSTEYFDKQESVDNDNE